MEKLTEERDQRTAAENREKEQNKRLQRQLRDTKEEMGELARKEAEASRKKHELVMPPTHRALSARPAEWLYAHTSLRAGQGWAIKKPELRSLEGGGTCQGDSPGSPKGRLGGQGWGTPVSIR